jgi:hypothetical protein
VGTGSEKVLPFPGVLSTQRVTQRLRELEPASEPQPSEDELIPTQLQPIRVGLGEGEHVLAAAAPGTLQL